MRRPYQLVLQTEDGDYVESWALKPGPDDCYDVTEEADAAELLAEIKENIEYMERQRS